MCFIYSPVKGWSVISDDSLFECQNTFYRQKFLLTNFYIPTDFLTFISVKADTILVTIATPAEGPSLGVAPSGT